MPPVEKASRGHAYIVAALGPLFSRPGVAGADVAVEVAAAAADEI